ncbi:ribulokinase [Apibacter sp. HY039]|uniref:ribulokinase n=1 Tax=Apibacter sp. HY039 TaxID=2501476 RepID=UPI000FEB884A|nr:ribulokinase [Apibacter sp. HY039]
MSDQYILGVDFGTLSVRSTVVRVSDGFEKGTAAVRYKHGVMDTHLTVSKNELLPPDFALQVPSDYLESFQKSAQEAILNSGVVVRHIIGIGIDFTSATVLATDDQGKPLCEYPEFSDRPHAYAKLWKHHGANEQAQRLLEVAKQRKEPWLPRYGGLLSSELLLPKVLETFEKDPEIYKNTVHFVDALDWMSWLLTGNLVYASADSGFKRHYQDGKYPDPEYLEKVSPGFGRVYIDKMSAPIQPLGSKSGNLTQEWAQRLGLEPGISVSVGNIDAHVTAAAIKAVEPGIMTAILGTSACYIVSGPEFKEVPGMLGITYGGVSDGTWCFEAGQSAFGDILAWYIQNCVPEEYAESAKNENLNLHDYLTRKASTQEIGEHGLLALDWHNGNRSILCDHNLSGMVLGLSLTTRAEDIYRALMESCAFGARKIIETMKQHGVVIKEIVAAGGLLKNKWLMQLISDVTRIPLSITEATMVGALGSAIYGSVAAGCYETLQQASDAMGSKIPNVYKPHEDRSVRYDELYNEYLTLHDYFGEGTNQVMSRLKKIKENAIQGKV